MAGDLRLLRDYTEHNSDGRSWMAGARRAILPVRVVSMGSAFASGFPLRKEASPFAPKLRRDRSAGQVGMTSRGLRCCGRVFVECSGRLDWLLTLITVY
jgi:hypothetical protein